MKRNLGLVVIVAALTYAATSAGQEVRPVPGAGTGTVTVQGTVNVGNAPSVRQDGEWRVALAGTPDVRVSATAPLEFVRIRGRYQVTWAARGDTETIVVVELGSGPWVRVESSNGRRRWVNLAAAEQVEELDGR